MIVKKNSDQLKLKNMKKLVLFPIVIAMMFLSKTLVAQDGENNFKNFRFGLIVQPDLAWYKPDNTKLFESSGSRIKFAYGLATEFRLNKVACFNTGIMVNYAGGGLNFLQDSTFYKIQTETGVDTTIFFIKSRHYNMIYADIPITLKMKTPEIGSMTYFGQFGINLSVRTKARALDKGTLKNTNVESTQENVDITKDMNIFQIGINIGAGAEYNLAGSTSVVFSINYHNGFSNIMKKESEFLIDKFGKALKQDTQSNYVSLTIGILF